MPAKKKPMPYQVRSGGRRQGRPNPLTPVPPVTPTKKKKGK